MITFLNLDVHAIFWICTWYISYKKYFLKNLCLNCLDTLMMQKREQNRDFKINSKINT